MAAAIVDTDYLIDAMRDVAGTRERLALRSREQLLGTTTVTLFELFRGAWTRTAQGLVGELTSILEVLTLDIAGAEEAANIWRTLRAGGTPIDTGDIFIGGIALSQGLPLLTRNRRDFDRIPGLTVLEL